MRLSVKTLSTWGVSGILFGSVAPVFASRPLVGLGFLALALGMFKADAWRSKIAPKAFLLILLLPGVLWSFLEGSEHTIRFAPFLFLLIFYPYRRFSIDGKKVGVVSVVLLSYLVLSQFAIAIGAPFALVYRETFYPIAFNTWNYGIAENLFLGFGDFRAAGLFYNPNVYALVLLLLWFSCAYSLFGPVLHPANSRSGEKKYWRSFLIGTVMVMFSLYLTGSRTALAGIVSFYVLVFGRQVLLSVRTLRLSVLGVFSILGAVSLFLVGSQRFMQGIVEDTGSFRVKAAILEDYIYATDLLSSLFGGEYGIQFDSEFGYWLGSAGVFGVAAILIFFVLLVLRAPITIPLVMSLMLIGLGSSVLYGLLTGSLAVAAILTTINFNREYHTKSFSSVTEKELVEDLGKVV